MCYFFVCRLFCCPGSKRSFTHIGVYTAIISVLWLALSVLGLVTHECVFNYDLKQAASYPDVSFIRQLLYILYLYSPSCKDVVPFPSVQDVTVFFPKEIPSAERTSIFMLTYAVVHALWFFSSILLINAGRNYSKISDRRVYSFVSPWISLTIIILFLDVTASIVYGLDISKTHDFDSVIDFADLEVLPLKDSITGGYGAYLTDYQKPSFIMTALFSKFIIIWLLNLGYLIKVLRDIKRRKKDPKNLILESRPHDAYMPSAHNPAFQDNDEFMHEVIPTHRIDEREMEQVAERIRPKSVMPEYIYVEPDLASRTNTDYGREDPMRAENERHPNFNRYLDRLEQEQQELRRQFPWSYHRPDGSRNFSTENADSDYDHLAYPDTSRPQRF